MPNRALALTTSAALLMAITACGSSDQVSVVKQSSTSSSSAASSSTSTSASSSTSSPSETSSSPSASGDSGSTSSTGAPNDAKLVAALKKAGCTSVPLRPSKPELSAKGVGSLARCKGAGTTDLRGFSVSSKDQVRPTFEDMTENQKGATIYYLEGDGWGIAVSPDGKSNPTKASTQAARVMIGEGTVQSYVVE